MAKQKVSFICNECGKVFDFDTDMPAVDGLEDFEITTHDVYCGGICKDCKMFN